MASDISNNSRAHMYNVSQICFVKKQSGKFTDNYEIKEQLGEGSYGKVCRCVSKISKLERAAKFIKKKSIDDPKGVQRFQGEVNILEQMDHQNIVKLYEVYEDDVNFYLIMDLLKGGELFDEIVKRSKFSENDAAEIMFQVFSSVNYLHKKGFVHRDLKPENICLESNQSIKLIDFGTARKFT